MFDRPVLLFAGASIHTNDGFASGFILKLRKFLSESDNTFKIGNWNPGGGEFYQKILDIWNSKIAEQIHEMKIEDRIDDFETKINGARKNIVVRIEELADEYPESE